jgi:Ca2+-binding RTX toxin-like protein
MLRLSLLVAAAFVIGAPAAYAGDVSANAGFLLIGPGNPNPSPLNNFTVTASPGGGAAQIEVLDTAGMTPNFGCTATSDSHIVYCDPFGVDQAAAFLQAGNDSFTMVLPMRTAVIAGDGNDTVDGGPADDQIEGDAGSDTLNGHDGNDTLTDLSSGDSAGGADEFEGGNGNDFLDGGSMADGSGAGGDLLNGGADVDTLSYAKRTQPLTVTEDNHFNDGQAGEGDDVVAVEHIILGPAADKATGDGSNNTLEGRNGNDALNGGNGNDVLLGQNGNDTLIGGGGADSLSGGAGLDKADYSARKKLVTVTIGVGANDGSVGEKDNVLDDVEAVIGGSGPDVLTGEDGANALAGGAGADHLSGLGGDDSLSGGTGADVLAGGSGDEVITGGPSPDQITGGSGDDAINAKDGAKDAIDCGTGDDRVTADPSDVVSSNCEHVTRAARPR